MIEGIILCYFGNSTDISFEANDVQRHNMLTLMTYMYLQTIINVQSKFDIQCVSPRQNDRQTPTHGQFKVRIAYIDLIEHPLSIIVFDCLVFIFL